MTYSVPGRAAVMRVSKSRKVCGYVKAHAKHQALAAKLAAKRDALRPLENRVVVALADLVQRRRGLTGGQQAEAQRIIVAGRTVAP